MKALIQVNAESNCETIKELTKLIQAILNAPCDDYTKQKALEKVSVYVAKFNNCNFTGYKEEK
jgi:hypothetical protein